MKGRIVLLAVLWIVLAVPAAWLQLMDGVMMDGRFFAQKNDSLYTSGEDSVAISRNDSGADISIHWMGQHLNVKLIVEQDRYSFFYEDGRSVQGYAGQWADDLTDADGAPIWMDDVVVITVGNNPSPDILTREYSLSNVLYRMVEGICDQRGHGLTIAAAMLIYALGVASFFWPEEVHFGGSRWMYVNAGLSDAGVAVQKLTGIACGAAGVVLLYLPLFW